MKFVESQSTKTNPFGENRVGERAYRRSERISAAIFLLTSHMSYDEPLKIRVREASLALLSDILSLRDEMRSFNSEKITSLKASIRELISLCRILAVSGFVSFQNVGVVSDALDELSSFLLASQRSALSEMVSFSREDFLDVRETNISHQRNVREVSHKTDKIVKDVGVSIDDNVSYKEDESKGRGKNMSARSQAILEVLRVGGSLGIRDVASNLPEFSEKMIQRELAALVQEGLVTKTGLKRWSRYALKKVETK